MQVQDPMSTISQREIYCIYSCSRDKNEFLFLTDEISRRRKPCTPEIGIDLLLCSDPDIYLLANCKRQNPFSGEIIRLTEVQCIFLHAFWTDATPSIWNFLFIPRGWHRIVLSCLSCTFYLNSANWQKTSWQFTCRMTNSFNYEFTETPHCFMSKHEATVVR